MANFSVGFPFASDLTQAFTPELIRLLDRLWGTFTIPEFEVVRQIRIRR
jgi:hypothetical protein